MSTDDVVKLFSSGVLCKLYANDWKLYSIITNRTRCQWAAE